MVSLIAPGGKLITLTELHDALADTGAILKHNLYPGQKQEDEKQHICWLHLHDEISKQLVENRLSQLGLGMVPRISEGLKKDQLRIKQPIEETKSLDNFAIKSDEDFNQFSNQSLEDKTDSRQQDYIDNYAYNEAPRTGSLRAIYRNDNFSIASYSPNYQRRLLNHKPSAYSHFGNIDSPMMDRRENPMNPPQPDQTYYIPQNQQNSRMS